MDATRRIGPRLYLVATAGLILLILAATFGLAYLIYFALSFLVGFQPTLRLPIEARYLGLVLFVVGIDVAADVMRFRKPREVLISTSDTFVKLIRNAPLEKRDRRTEPFIPRGPYVYVRNPMYFGVVAISLGFGLLFSSLPLLLWGVILICWFWFILIPFEEKELQGLFGESYVEYRRQVPKLFPYGKKYTPN